MRLSDDFVKYHRSLLGSEYRDFIEYFRRSGKRNSVRVNTLKSSVREVKRIFAEYGIEYGRISWCPHGLYVGCDSLDFMEHQLGLYYVQSSSSMVAPQVLGLGKHVLDLCAAPGGKSTHIAQLMENRGSLVANDNNPQRIKALVYNIQRMGVSNACVTVCDGVGYDGCGRAFDRVLVDAPCSNIATLKSNPDAVSDFSLRSAAALSNLQKKLIVSGFDLLMDGGVLVYSTCTTTLEENEYVVEYLLGQRRQASVSRAKLNGLVVRRGLTEDTLDCARIYPMDNETEPNFVAVVEKNE